MRTFRLHCFLVLRLLFLQHSCYCLFVPQNIPLSSLPHCSKSDVVSVLRWLDLHDKYPNVTIKPNGLEFPWTRESDGLHVVVKVAKAEAVSTTVTIPMNQRALLQHEISISYMLRGQSLLGDFQCVFEDDEQIGYMRRPLPQSCMVNGSEARWFKTLGQLDQVYSPQQVHPIYQWVEYGISMALIMAKLHQFDVALFSTSLGDWGVGGEGQLFLSDISHARVQTPGSCGTTLMNFVPEERGSHKRLLCSNDAYMLGELLRKLLLDLQNSHRDYIRAELVGGGKQELIENVYESAPQVFRVLQQLLLQEQEGDISSAPVLSMGKVVDMLLELKQPLREVQQSYMRKQTGL